MEQVFFAHSSDELAVAAVQRLLKLGCRVQILSNGQPVPRECVAVFTLPKGVNCGRNKARMRWAAHRLRETVPPWAKNAWLPVGVRRLSDSALRCVSELRHFDPRQFDLNRLAPWGPVPRDEANFSAYCDWIRTGLLLDPQAIGVQWQPDFFTRRHRLELEHALVQPYALGSALGKKGYASACVRGAGLCQEFEAGNQFHRQHLVRLARAVRLYLLEPSNDNKTRAGLQLSAGPQTSAFIKEMLRAILSQRPVTLYIPTCPPWSYNETGYTFGRVCQNSRGICYDMMVGSMMQFLQLFRHLGVEVLPTVIIGDVELFDLQDGAYALDEPAEEAEFMACIRQQQSLLTADLTARQVENAQVTTALSLCGREEYLRLRSRLQTAIREQLQDLGSTRRLLHNVIDLQRRLYARQCRMRYEDIDAADPPAAVREAAIGDVVIYQAILELLQKQAAGRCVCYFVQDDPFRPFYEGHPHIGWKSERGVF